MAELASDTGALRFRLEVVQRTSGAGAPLLCGAAVEYLDRRDGEWWPLVRPPPLFVAAESLSALADGLAALLRGDAPGLAWQAAPAAEVGLQVGPAGPAAEPFLAEVGIDLGRFLADAAGAPGRGAAELALLRFPATRAGLVAFAAALRGELEGLAAP